jgi:hypothetical protein
MYRDHPSIAANRFILGITAGDFSHAWALVTSYDDATHTASVTLQPSGDPYAGLRVLSSHRGWSPTLYAGDQVLVACEKGLPQAVVGFAHSDLNQPNATSAALESGLWVSGVLHGDVLELAKYLALPDATPDMRGKMVFVSSTANGVAGTADQLYICVQDAAGILGWIQIA